MAAGEDVRRQVRGGEMWGHCATEQVTRRAGALVDRLRGAVLCDRSWN
jgi:hypothetical protein